MTTEQPGRVRPARLARAFLRDRIAAVITDGKIAGDGHGTIADAVIAELGICVTYQVFAYDERYKSVRVDGGLTADQASRLAADVGGWVEEER